MVKSPLFCDLYQWLPSKLSLSNVISGWLSSNQWHSDSQRINIFGPCIRTDFQVGFLFV